MALIGSYNYLCLCGILPPFPCPVQFDFSPIPAGTTGLYHACHPLISQPDNQQIAEAIRALWPLVRQGNRRQ